MINQNRLDPIDTMDKADIIKLLKRENIPYQERQSVQNMRELVKRRQPLQVQPYQ